MNKNTLFVALFSGILVLSIYLTSSFSPQRSIQQIPKDPSSKIWASGDYGQAKKNNLDIKKLQQALVNAKSPQDFEEKVNAIYQGEGVISINIQNTSDKTQFVHLYIDKEPKNGKMDDSEKMLSLERRIDSNEQKGQVLVNGYGNYSHYSSTSPFFYGMAGAMVGNWLTSSPSYSTPISRQNDIQSNFKEPLKKKQRPTWGGNTNKGSWKGSSPRSKTSNFFSKGKGWGSRSRSSSGFGRSFRGFGRRR